MRKILLVLCILLSACNGSKKSAGKASSGTVVWTPAGITVASGTIQLTWAAGSGTTTGYHVEQSTDGVFFQQIQTVAATSANINGATIGQPYHFRIRAFNSAGNSPYSGIVTVTP